MDLVKKIKGRNLPNGYKLISFDVENCFTSISPELAIKLVERDFDQYIKKNTDIPKKNFINLLKFCLIDCNYFCYENEFISMKTGLFMGSSLAPIIDEALLKIEFLTPFWYSYVDDHITAIPEDKIDDVLNALHDFDPNIKFTYEIEEQQRLNYLDLSIYRNSTGGIMTNWYHKPIASNRLLNFYSNHPHKMKMNVAKAFIRKVFRVSHKSFWESNLLRIKEILSKNNYPEKLINKLISEVRCRKARTGTDSYAYLSINNTTAPKEDANHTMQPQRFASLTYVPDLSESISKTFRHFVPDIKMAMRPHHKNNKMFANLKSKIPKDEKSGLVYKIDCADCEAVYIGETTQKFGMRKYQHKCDCKKQITKNSSALAMHAKENGHNFNFDEAKILKTERNKLKLQIHEVNQIIIHEDIACNKKTDKKEYTNTYINLIKNCNR